MGQRPILRDGRVVNIIALEDDTVCVSAAEFKTLRDAENAAYAAKSAEWRQAVAEQQAAISAAKAQAFVATGVASALKIEATVNPPAPHLVNSVENRIANAETEAKTAAAQLAKLSATPWPARPRPVRGKYWVCPDGATLGSPGGNIGDTWTGKAYQRGGKA